MEWCVSCVEEDGGGTEGMGGEGTWSAEGGVVVGRGEDKEKYGHRDERKAGEAKVDPTTKATDLCHLDLCVQVERSQAATANARSHGYETGLIFPSIEAAAARRQN